MLYWSKTRSAPRPEPASAWRTRPRRYALRRRKSTRSSKSTCMCPGAWSGRSHRWRGSGSGAGAAPVDDFVTGRAAGAGFLLAMTPPSELGGGLRPPSEASPQDSVARATPALEAEHMDVGDLASTSYKITPTGSQSARGLG